MREGGSAPSSVGDGIEPIRQHLLAALQFIDSCKPANLECSDLELARRVYAARRHRDTLLAAAAPLCSDPGWDLLLDLFIAHQTGQSLSVSSACIGACAPPTTGLRYIAAAQKAEIIERSMDADDRRRQMIRLTDFGVSIVRGYLNALRAPNPFR